MFVHTPSCVFLLFNLPALYYQHGQMHSYDMRCSIVNVIMQVEVQMGLMRSVVLADCLEATKMKPIMEACLLEVWVVVRHSEDVAWDLDEQERHLPRSKCLSS